MKDTTYVPLKNDLLLKLIERYKENYPRAIGDVIEEFLNRTGEVGEDNTSPRDGGYIWDQLELPAGTQLRTRYFDKWQVAILEKGVFRFNRKSYRSPAKVCNAMRGNKITNAWDLLQIKRPGDIDFQKAGNFRD
jgi:hypothetical protein